MPKINWKVRFSNPVFIVQLLMSVLAPILAYMGLNTTDLTSWSILGGVLLDAIRNPYVLSLVAVSVFACINDPTTKGVSDSERALNYQKPSDGSQDDI